MNKIYADLIINNIKDFSKVPDEIKKEVRDLLVEYHKQGKISEEEYQILISK